MTSQAEAVSGDRRGRTVPGGGQALALATLCTLLFLTFLDNTVVSVALGDIQVSLKANVSDLQWVVGAYALTFASIMLACGMIGDELGRKKVMLAGAGVFCAGSVLCALAPNVQTLIAGRAVMGLGAAASEPGTLSMLRHLYPDARARNRAIGVWAATSGFALAAGPVVGGVLTGVWSWRGIFWFNLAFGLAALIVAAVILPESADPTAKRVDTAGTILGAGALATFVFAIIDAESAGFGSTAVIILLCLSAVLFAAFGWWERRAPNPLLDLRYLRVPQFTTANITAFCTYFATFAIFFFTALYLVEVVNASGYRLALIFLPMTVLMIVASVLAGRWTDATGPRWSITIGCVLLAAGLFWTDGVLSPNPDYAVLTVALALAGIGIGTTVVPDHLLGAVRGAAGAVRHGRVGQQHQPGDRRRHRGRRARLAGVLAAARQPGRADEPSRRAQGLPGPGHQRHRDRLRSRRTPPPTRASASWCRRLSARPTRPSTTACMRRCTCPRGWCWPPGCSRSSRCAHGRSTLGLDNPCPFERFR